MNKMKLGLAAALLCASGVTSTSFGQEAPADAAKDAVDPYNPGSERSRFLSAAGVDSELSEEEFTANAKASDPFVRKFDSWATLRAFDRNGNKTVDWFEADGYRRAIRTAVLAAFDKDKDGSLGESEREAANKELAAGKLPRISLPSATRPTPGTRPDGERPQPGTPGTPGTRPDNGTPRPDRNSPEAQAEREARNKETRTRYETFLADYTKQNDKDGDGKLTIAELDSAREARMEELRKSDPDRAARIDEWVKREQDRRAEYIKNNDKDGDGKLSEAEEQAARQARLDEWKKRDPERFARFEEQRAEWEARRAEEDKRWDTDGDGKLSDVERRLSESFQRDEGRRRMEEVTKKYDKDGDGQLNDEERRAMFQGEGFGRGGRGGDRGGDNNQPRGNNNQPNRGDL